MIEIATVGQYHDGDRPAVAISGQDSQGDGFPERQAGGELFGTIAIRLFRFWAVDSPEPDARWLVVQKHGDRAAVSNADDAGFDLPRGSQEADGEQSGKQGGEVKRRRQELEAYCNCRRVVVRSGYRSPVDVGEFASDPEKLAAAVPLLHMSTNIEIELLRQNDMLRGAVTLAMDKIRQMRAGQKIDTTAVLETLGKQLSEARATNEELFAGMVAPELVVGGPSDLS